MRALFTLLALAACNSDETLTAYADGVTVFALETLNGAPFTARATIDISEPGRVTGQAPCNRYFAAQTAPYPWFKLGPVGATKMACPDLNQEGAFLRALSQMTLSEIAGSTLILSNDAGQEMVFQAP